MFTWSKAWRMPGALMTGHADLACETCHRPADGTLRQQLQAFARNVVGLDDHEADFGARPVDQGACLACHERPDDRHPVFRFAEPRFASAREALGSIACATCHAEHSERMVSSNGTFCRHCHEQLVMKNDPLDTPHEALVAREAWSTCLGCHDFHGNHDHRPPTATHEALDSNVIERYLVRGESPYGSPIVRAKEGDTDAL